MRIVPPQVKVHYWPPKPRVTVLRETWSVKPQTTAQLIKPSSPYRLRSRFILPFLIVIPLLSGVAIGGYGVWQSKFGEAEPDDAKQNNVLQVRGPGAPKPIPLNFDQSELTVVANLLPLLISENRHEPTIEERRNAERKEKLKTYLGRYNSPLADDQSALDELLKARNMKMVLAISFVESNFCKRQQYHNCSGIGGSTYFRKYPDFGGWVKDMDDLLERRYKNLPVEDFIGVYVQPGSQNWVDGVHQILDELRQGKIE